MRIERIELDGFGRFADRRWELGEGLTVLLGENEAGKTTLLNAIRALLFGFESTREGRTWYPPLAGGRRGGRLTLLTAGGERWSVERHGERGGVGALSVTAPNGNQGGQETLDRLLGGADRDLFNNIFAFGLGELEAFSSLSGEGVRSRIYGAGSGLGGMSALDLERRLRAEQEAAYKPRGREQTINRLLSAIEELRARIAQLEQQPAEYDAARSELAGLRQHHAELRADRIAAVERRERLKRLLDAQAPAAQLAALESELAEGDAHADALAPDAEALLDRGLAAVREAAARLAALDESIESAERRLAGVAIDDALLAEAAEIGALRDERLIHEQRAAQRQQADASATRFAAELDDQLRRVGGWSEERLLAMDDSIATVEATRAADQRLSATRAAAERIGQRLESIRAEVAAAEREVSDTAPLDEGEIVARRSTVAELGELRARRAALDERARVLAERPAAAQPRWLLPAAGAALLVLLGVVAGAALGAVPIGAVAGLLLGLVAAGMLWRRPGAAASPSSANDDLRQLAERRAILLERLGLGADADTAAIGAIGDELAAAQAGARQGRERSARLAERRTALERLESESAAAEQARTEAGDGWRAWLLQRQLPDELTPEAVRQVLAAVGIGRRAAAERAEQLGRRATIDEAAAAFDARLDALHVRLGRPRADSPAMRPASVAALAESLQQAAADQRRADELTASLADARRRRAPLAGADAAARKALAAHLASCGAADPDQLRLMAQVAADRRELRGRIRETHAALSGIAGSGEAVAALLDEARAHDPATLEAQRDEAAGEANRLEAAESEVLTREGALQARIGELEHADELGERRQELAIAQAQADAEARRWSVRAVALALLGETRRRYERERQPQVVQDAQSYFATITDGRYPRIVAPPGEVGVRVEQESGSPRTTEELSRGTAEQLYLALRFGLIEQFGRSADPLPVVMDDILVNFDPGRAARAARAIGQLAARHQVVFLTCHPAAAELLDPDGVVTQRLD